MEQLTNKLQELNKLAKKIVISDELLTQVADNRKNYRVNVANATAALDAANMAAFKAFRLNPTDPKLVELNGICNAKQAELDSLSNTDVIANELTSLIATLQALKAKWQGASTPAAVSSSTKVDAREGKIKAATLAYLKVHFNDPNTSVSDMIKAIMLENDCGHGRIRDYIKNYANNGTV